MAKALCLSLACVHSSVHTSELAKSRLWTGKGFEGDETRRDSLYAQIPCAEDIQSLQPKTREHLHAPLTQPAHCNQLLNQLSVAGLYQHLGAQLARGKLLC
jgi:hypothetical protein